MAQSPDKKTYVEIPFIVQLQGIGWEHIEDDIDVRYLTKRDRFPIERGHTDRFWLQKKLGWKPSLQFERWLNENGADLDLWISPHEKYLGHQERELSDPKLAKEALQRWTNGLYKNRVACE